jgi:hyperosmotically inducible periplasmic protein
MKGKFILFSLVAVTAAGFGFVGCASDDSSSSSTKRTTGQYIDDKVVIQRVKSALGDSEVYKFPDVKVEAYQGTVQLTGFVDSTEQKQKAEQIARNVRGVASVQNNIVLKSDVQRVRDVNGSVTNATRSTTTP